jgi:2-polyprenyl-3-methyl-5-hydroxy-6-metoxy-1,4-benzoquinol methylase
MARLGFALWSLKARFHEQHNLCPYCGSSISWRLQRKKLLIEARRCQYCDLIFRWPTDTLDKAMRFYEQEYRSGIVTDLPSQQELSQLGTNGFRESRYDKSRYVELVKTIRIAPARLLDFGASWGYVSSQLQNAGYTVEGFELSRTRADFGRTHLGVPIHFSWEQLQSCPWPRFDAIFTAHTLEHVCDLRSILNKFAETIVSGGFLLIIVPNAGGRDARRLGVRWGPYIGETHTIAFTADWFRNNLPRHGFMPIEIFSTTATGKDLMCDGEELVCIARYSAGT